MSVEKPQVKEFSRACFCCCACAKPAAKRARQSAPEAIILFRIIGLPRASPQRIEHPMDRRRQACPEARGALRRPALLLVLPPGAVLEGLLQEHREAIEALGDPIPRHAQI